jgi:hypothetical protein
VPVLEGTHLFIGPDGGLWRRPLPQPPPARGGGGFRACTSADDDLDAAVLRLAHAWAGRAPVHRPPAGRVLLTAPGCRRVCRRCRCNRSPRSACTGRGWSCPRRGADEMLALHEVHAGTGADVEAAERLSRGSTR